MKQYLRFISFLLAAVLLCISFTACKSDGTQNDVSLQNESSLVLDNNSESSENQESSEISEPEKTAAMIYAEAVERFKEHQNFGISAELEHTRTSGLQKFNETSDINVKFLSYGTDDMRVCYESEVEFLKQEAEITEIFADGVVYQTYNDGEFKEEMTAAEYLERIVSPILLDAELYSEIAFADNSKDGETVILFGSANGIEKWAAPEYAKLADAAGCVVIDSKGNIVSNTCELRYEQGVAEVELSISVEIEYYEEKNPEISVPEKAEDYQTVDYIDALTLFSKVSAVFDELSVFEYNAIELAYFTGAAYSEVVRRNGYYFDDGDEVLIKENSNSVSTSVGEQISHSAKEEINGLEYKYEIDGETETFELTKSQQRERFLQGIDVVGGFDIDEMYISSVSFEAIDGYIVLTAKGNEDYDRYIRSYWNDSLYGDEAYLDDLADSYKSGKLEYAVTMDIDTFLPVAVNFDYDGIYTLEEQEYELGYEKQCSVVVGSADTYVEITDEYYAEADKEPSEDEKATPLFYKITGENGETMYLLGTIHIGDNRTAYLPEEIYNAFSSSDALAVEVNVEETDTKLIENEELLNSYYEGNYYTDGSKLSEHIDEELFKSAELLASQLGIGGYGDYVGEDILAYKPNFVASSIENIYHSHHKLTTSKGVDVRLLKKAKADGKKIYEVEEWDDSLGIFVEYSDKIREMILESTLETGKTYYSIKISEMFDAWCNGNIDELTEMVNDEEFDTENMTEEELEALKEYDASMSTDRDEKMLQKAIEYLESGETVFVAIGLAHILDSDSGLVKTLAEAGYTVELVEFE